MKNVTIDSQGRPRAARGAEDGSGGQYVPTDGETCLAMLCQLSGAYVQQHSHGQHTAARREFGAVTHGAEGGGATRTQPTKVEQHHKRQVNAWGWKSNT